MRTCLVLFVVGRFGSLKGPHYNGFGVKDFVEPKYIFTAFVYFSQREVPVTIGIYEEGKEGHMPSIMKSVRKESSQKLRDGLTEGLKEFHSLFLFFLRPRSRKLGTNSFPVNVRRSGCCCHGR